MVQIPSGGQTSTTGGEFLAHSEGSLSNRWLALIGGLTLQCCGGASYCFSLYSQALKTHLSYSQQLLDALGTAKDIGGNVGILSGLLYDVVPTWTVILVGALCTSLGFGMQWLALSGRISKPPFWQMAAFVFLAAQGATFFNTAVLVSNVSNFSGCRGIVLGLLKGYIGLSGALLSQLYLALYAPDQEGFLLLLTWLPILIAMLAMLVVHPIGSPAADQEEDASGGARWRFKLMYGVGGSLALFLMSAIILQHTVHINRKENVAIAVAMIALYSLHAIVLQRSRDEHTEQTHPAVLCILNNGQTQQTYDQQWQRPRSQSSKQGVREALLQTSREAAPSTSSSSSPSSSCRDESKRNHVNQVPESVVVRHGKGSIEDSTPSSWRKPPHLVSPLARTEPPMHGDNFSVSEALLTIDFWLLFLAMICSAGSGLTAINNLAQMGHSLGYPQHSTNTFVSLVSIWNFFGRVGGGGASEIIVRRGLPRPLGLLVAQGALMVSHLLFASGVSGALYFGCIITGLGYGAIWALMPSIASEIFGLQHFGVFYNTLASANPIGSYILSTCVAGYLYDREAEKQRHQELPGVMHVARRSMTACSGPQCFYLTFLICATVTALGLVLSAFLAFRTKVFYASLNSRMEKLPLRSIDPGSAHPQHERQ